MRSCVLGRLHGAFRSFDTTMSTTNDNPDDALAVIHLYFLGQCVTNALELVSDTPTA